MIDDFQSSRPGRFPKSWRTWPFQRGAAKRVYAVAAEEDNHYLQARDEASLSSQIFREFHWRIGEFPYLNWRWRARILPKGGKESDPAANDSACGVYVVFGKTSRTAIKYVWSTSLPKGTVYEKRTDQMFIKVLDLGKPGMWKTHSVHIPNDYQALFKRLMPRAPTGIGVLTDGNATGTPAACDYDDFTLSRVPLYKP